ncbi:MAG: phosphatase PAP2 family protein [Clostridia bacterium]|nr:phosphatase PAP2 family protein [Clostridia bacterium]
MEKKKKIIVSVVLFVLVFAGLLVTATFTDLQVSKILTSRALVEHNYITNDFFGATLEAVGTTPIYILLAFVFEILFWHALYNRKGAGRIVLAAFAQVAAAVSAYVMFDDTLGYIKKHLILMDNPQGLRTGMYLKLICLFFAVITAFAAAFAVKNFSEESINKLFGFSIATIIVAALPTILINLVIKDYVGRIRFRAMNMYPDNEQYGFAAFARWYEVNGQWMDKAKLTELFSSTDALKSFPSGHTASAGMAYCLTMLNDALGIKNKKVRALFWILPVVVTGLVAVSRIVVGAHFFSDVLVGGTFSFVTMIIAREIFVCKGSNIKALKG